MDRLEDVDEKFQGDSRRENELLRRLMVSWDDSDERLVDLTREVDLWLEGRSDSVWIPITFSLLDTLLIMRLCLASGVEEGTNSSGRVSKTQVAAGSGQNDNQGPQGQGEGDER